MIRSKARKSFTSMIIRVSGGRRLRLTLRPRPRISRALLALLAGALGAPAYALDGAALPQGGQVSAGQASIAQSGANMTINQTSNSAVLNWQSFNVGSQAQVEFVQPSSSAVALNRVVGNEGSQIHGQIKANGQVFLSNPNGVVFAPGSEVNVGGLVATTLSLDDQAFMQGQYQLAGNSQAEVSNAGQLTATGSVALVGATVRNTGSIEAAGDVALTAGQRVSLDLHGDGLLSLSVDASALRGQVENGAAIQAGNQVLLTATAAGDLIGSVVNNTGVVRASGLSVEGGRISLSGGLVAQTGTLDASGAAGGQIEISAHTLQDAGQTLAQGSSGQGGSIRVNAEQITQTSSAQMNADGHSAGGQITLQGGAGELGKLYSSATLSAQGLGESAEGGEISVTANSTQLRAAQLDASGQAGGGSIKVGGGWQGQDASVANAQQTGVNASTQLRADAKQNGDGGTVVVWSDEQTTFAGHISATGGSQSGNGGQLEVSGKENLTFAGTVNTASPFGLGGSLLLDPKNIVISDAAALFDVLNLDDPNAGSMNWFGYFAEEVASGNIAITASRTDIGGVANVGAAYLFDGESGALLSALYGSAENDQVGTGGITVLSDGAYVVRSQVWNNAGILGAGATTYGAADTGVSGVVSAANSLVGSSAFDQVGIGVTALSDGAYVVNSNFWDNGGIADAGAATYGVAGVGISGVISAANSLVGSTAGDRVGANFALGDGAYVVLSSSWDGDGVADAGAVTYGAAGLALTGTINASNSLVGSRPNDRVGSHGITVLSDGAYVVPSRNWNNSLGAVTYGAAGFGINGEVSSLNSLLGSSFGDQVGSGGVTALVDGAYAVSSPLWNNAGLADAGAVTYGAAGTALIGTISASNSLVGGAAFDQAGSGGVTALVDGAYVVRSPNWDNAGVIDGGAATYGAEGTALVGTISVSNSLVGTQASDQVGSVVFSLSDGAYVVSSYFWDNGSIVNAGAATYGAAGTALTGAVTVDNSFVGASAGDQLGGVFALSDGAYMVLCANCDNAGLADVGAVTYGSASFGITGVVGISNSLVGGQANDRVGSGGITALSDGAYVVVSPSWDSGSVADAGAVTYGAAGTALIGTIDSSNSLVGSTAGDQLGLYDGAPSILALGDGSYAVRSHLWDNGGVVNVGAVTYGAAGAVLSGSIDAGNSLLGSITGDLLGYRGLVQLSDGRVLVRSPNQIVNGRKTGRVSLVDFNPAADDLAFNDSPSADFSIHPDRIAAILNGGTSITLQANNDITLASDLLVDNASGNGGHLTLQAGRNLSFNANLTTDNGDLTAVAGDPGALVDQREAGTPTLSIANGVTLDVGTGTATLAAIDGNFVNSAGSGAIQTSGAGRYLIYASDPATSLEGLSGYSKHYNQGFALGSVPAYASSGNWFLYSIAPVLSVTPNASSQVYGDLSLAGLGYGLSGFIDADTLASSGVSGTAVFTSAASATSDVGSYDLAYVSGLASSLGYSFADAAASTNELSITQRAITLAASIASKIYGDADPTLGVTVSAGSLAGSDNVVDVAGTLSREAGENVGSYDIALGSGLKAGNYTISFDTDNNAVTITPRAITLTANAASKVYGEADPALSVSVGAGSLASGDSLADVAGTLSREAGENVGSYDIALGTGLKAGNYTISFDADNNAVTITPRAITLTADAASKVYGEADPALAVSVGAGSLASGDSLADVAGTLSREVGENVGSYDIALGTGLKAGNYTISFDADNNAVTITPRAITLTADAASKVYGEADPTLAVSVGAGSLASGDSLADVAGTLSREAGENVGSYDIALGSGLKAGNYTVSFDTANNAVAITPRAITLTADAASKVYGEVDPALAVSVGAGSLANGDSLADVAGTLSREAGENVGSYDIALGAGLKAGNYTISFDADNNAVTITPRAITLTADVASKIYGDVDPALAVSVGSGSLASGDSLADVAGTLSREAGENVGSYDIALGTGLKAGNYTISFDADNNAVTITPRAITLTADAANKVYGEADSALSVSVGAGSLASGDSLADVAGTLSREAGENVGSYDIALGAGLKAGNYTISFDADNNAVTITPRAITLTADAASKVYGEADPTLAVSVGAGSLASGDSLADVAGTLSREAGENVGSYDIALGAGLKAGNYTISFDADNNAVVITPRQLVATVDDAERYHGEENPAFSVSYSGWAFADDEAVLLGEPEFVTPAVAASAVGDYAVSASGVTAANYTLSFVDGTLRVLEAPVLGNSAVGQQVAAVTAPLLSFSTDEQVPFLFGAGSLPERIARLTGDDADSVAGVGSDWGNLLTSNQGIRMPEFASGED